MTNTIATRWLPSFRPNPRASLRLFCFPYAGGSNLIFREWPADLPAHVEVCAVQLAGRGGRLYEKPHTKMEPLVPDVAQALQPYLDKPFAFFGHSMGALISFELARWLRRQDKPEPLHLFVAGHGAPQIPATDPYTFDLPEAEFIEELRRLNGTPKEVLLHTELMQLRMPLLRADFELTQTYTYTAEPPLTCPISAFGGLADEEVKRELIEQWREQTRSSFSLSMFPGDHFFLNTARQQLLHTLSRELLHSREANLRRV
jgi:medium-chain acyl-[acyl-carrier-protein] hydrolase